MSLIWPAGYSGHDPETSRLARDTALGLPYPGVPPGPPALDIISGVLANLLGEAALFWSPALLGWFALFAIANAVYIPLSEEPGLERRFGDEYRRYREAVPRWIPRWQPYLG